MPNGIVGFDGHGTNSWAAHYDLIVKSLALFLQLPWGAAYTDPEPGRAEIAAPATRGPLGRGDPTQIDTARQNYRNSASNTFIALNVLSIALQLHCNGVLHKTIRE